MIGVDRGESEKYLGVVDVASLCALDVVEALVGRGSAFVRPRIAGFVAILMWRGSTVRSGRDLGIEEWVCSKLEAAG